MLATLSSRRTILFPQNFFGIIKEYCTAKCYTMNRVSILAGTVSQTCLRRLSTTEVRCRKPDISKIKKMQEHFQQDNGIPVYIKGGAKDHALFYLTVALTLCGLGGSLHSTYKLATK